MNHLAHLYLSRTQPQLMIGNFIADEVKGKNFQQYPPIISQGIVMHRAIDHFTDTHAITLHTRNIFRSKFRLYSGVLVDMMYDHVLAKNWSRFHDEPLEQFAAESYAVLDSFEKQMPEFSVFFFNRMKHYNWLCMYATEQGIDSVICSMAKRINKEGQFDEAIEVYRQHQLEIDDDFFSFFPLLQNHVESYTTIDYE